jgi:hypothetical protein
MTLTLHYELHLPIGTAREEVHRLLSDLRCYAETLTLAEVSPLVVLANPGDVIESRWVAIAKFCSARAAVRYARDPRPGADPNAVIDVLDGDVSSAQVFFVRPGEGCEPASFGFVERWNEARTRRELSWRCDCKTQFASNVSEAHFLACHLNLVHLLDRAVALGIAVDARDEGEYWETRSEKTLLSEMRRNSHVLARFAGVWSDAVGDGS